MSRCVRAAGGFVAWHVIRRRVVASEVAMSINGLITTKDVLKHSATIVREFGAATYLRCCLAILRGRQTTFLNVVFPR
jgi:hypothetical protein